MKLGLVMAGLIVGTAMLGGCETLSQTPGENANQVWHAMDTTAKQIPDDVEMLLLIDKPIRLSEKPVPRH